jgi:hypothetical protein
MDGNQVCLVHFSSAHSVIQILKVLNTKVIGRYLKVPKCEVLICWILMIFFYHEVSIGRGLVG